MSGRTLSPPITSLSSLSSQNLTENSVDILNLGLLSYPQALQIQRATWQKIKDGLCPHALILCEHPPAITIGRSSKGNDLRVSAQRLSEMDIPTYEVDRGGGATYHGPGQLIVYPIFNLRLFKKDIRWFVQLLEEVIIKLLGRYGIASQRRPGYPGVWVSPFRDRGLRQRFISDGADSEKIASLGIGIRDWITYHGAAVNINTDLSFFRLIRPCGLDIRMTSLHKLLNYTPDFNEIKTIVGDEFAFLFGLAPFQSERLQTQGID